MDDDRAVAHALADAVLAQYLREDDCVLAASKALRETAIELSRWLGPDGSAALLARACHRASQKHGSLRNLRIVANSAPVLEGVADCVAAEGMEPVAAGLKATLVELFDSLVRMVGEDVTRKLALQITARGSGREQREDSIE